MEDSDRNLLNEPLRTQLVNQLFKYGPSWVLLFLLVGFLGYELHYFVSYAGPATAEYVSASRRIDEQNAKHVALLISSQERASKEHEAMLASLKSLLSGLDESHVEHEGQTASIDNLLRLIESAVATMSVVPGQRQQQLELLDQINVGIEELKTSIDFGNGRESN
jgi:hypothetical protein